jgi:hypothetical protein
MSSQMTLKVGSVTGTLVIGATITDVQVAAALTRYANALMIDVSGTQQQNLESILKYIAKEIRDISKTSQVNEAVSTAKDAAAAQAEIDNLL